MVKYRLLPGAELDLEDAVDWYREQDPNTANRFLDAVFSTLRMIADDPTVWPKYDRRRRYYVLDPWPFSIVYLENGDKIEVVAVAHAKRKPGYWRRRDDGS